MAGTRTADGNMPASSGLVRLEVLLKLVGSRRSHGSRPHVKASGFIC
jgi:hypothetical protein